MSGSSVPIRRVEEGLLKAWITESEKPMAKFMYLFRNNPPAYRSMSPEQMQHTLKKWMDWKDELDKNGTIKRLGERLDGMGKVVRGKSKSVSDGPYIEVKDFVQGY